MDPVTDHEFLPCGVERNRGGPRAGRNNPLGNSESIPRSWESHHGCIQTLAWRSTVWTQPRISSCALCVGIDVFSKAGSEQQLDGDFIFHILISDYGAH